MEFGKAISIVREILTVSNIQIKDNDYDGIIVKKLTPTNTLKEDRTTNQTHIAITGPQMDIFPYLKAEGYFEAKYNDKDDDLKKYFVTQIPAYIFKNNVDYLNDNVFGDLIDFKGENKKKILTSIVRSRRNKGSDQIEMSYKNFDSPDFILFRKLFYPGVFLIILKIKNKFEYEFYGIKPIDSIKGKSNLEDLHNTFSKLATNTLIDVTSLQIKEGKVEGLPYNRIIFGAPGTGKSFKLEKERAAFGNNYERVTFHPNYSYAQFVGTYKPVPEVVTDSDGKEVNTITYKYVPGPFMRVLVKALKSQKNYVPTPHLLLIEEINRANVSAVFGDVFQLLDRKDGVSEYTIETNEDMKNYLLRELKGKDTEYDKIRIPNNMYIWATMNSADQGVFPMDTAFKRRWDFEYIGIDEKADEIESIIVKLGKGMYEKEVSLNKLRMAINSKLSGSECRVNEDKLLGPYFLSKEVLQADDVSHHIVNNQRFIDAFKNKVLMYLFEDAARQHRSKIFTGCDHSKFSSVCSAFEEKGLEIFSEDIKSAAMKEK